MDGNFQCIEESRNELLIVVHSRQSLKPTYGDALVNYCPVEPMNTF